MNRQCCTLLTTSVFFLAVTAGAFAAAPAGDAEQAQLLSTLEARAKWLDSNAKGQKGAHRMLMDMQSVRLKKLIQRLQAGEQVDPQEIDSLLRKGRHLGD
jgi:hypothetical protein